MGEKPNTGLGAEGAPFSGEIAREKMQAFLTAYEQANVKAMAGLFSKNRPLYVGTGSHEFQHGRNNILNQFKSDFEQSRPDQRVMRLGEVKASAQRGLIGCLAHLEYCPEAGTVPMRVTGFLVNEADEWRWASMHFSFPAAEQTPGDSIPVPPSLPIAFDTFRKRFGREEVDLLWIAESEVAKNAVLKGLKARENENIWRIDSSARIDYVGRFGDFDAVLTYSTEGKLHIEHALQRWRPKIVILFGVALRLNKTEFHRGPGDVVVSQEVITQGDGEHQPVASPHKTSLREHLQECIKSWEYSGGNGTLVYRCYEGPLISGDHFPGRSARDALCGRFPQSIGFELQSAGICSAINAMGIDWIVAKGVCDWEVTQPENQVLPATTAVDFMRHLLGNRQVLEKVS